MNPISVRSWHYRLVFYVMGKWYFQKYEKCDDDYKVKIVPKNITLCKYFWSVVLCCGIFHSMVLIKEVCVPVYNFLDALNHKRPIKWPKLKSPTKFKLTFKHMKMVLIPAFIAVGIIHIYSDNYFFAAIQFVLAGIFLLPQRLFDGIAKWRFKRYMVKIEKESKEKKPKSHNLTLEYLKARKGKYCPVLRFYEPVDDEEN